MHLWYLQLAPGYDLVQSCNSGCSGTYCTDCQKRIWTAIWDVNSAFKTMQISFEAQSRIPTYFVLVGSSAISWKFTVPNLLDSLRTDYMKL